MQNRKEQSQMGATSRGHSPFAWARGQSGTETSSLRRSSPFAWARGQSMVEMAIIAPIAIGGLLMWIELNSMTSMQHKVIAATYEGVKVVSQFSDLYIADCMNEQSSAQKVKKMCKAMISSAECNAHYPNIPDGPGPENLPKPVDPDHPEIQLTPDQKTQIFSALDDLLPRKTLCATMVSRRDKGFYVWRLMGWRRNPATYTPIHYYKDASGTEYGLNQKLPDNTEIREYIGTQSIYPSAVSLGRYFGVKKYEAQFVTLLNVFQTPPSGGGVGWAENEPCVFAARSEIKNIYQCDV